MCSLGVRGGAECWLLPPLSSASTTLAASFSRTPPSRPRASARSRALACGRHGGRTLASTLRRILRRAGNLHDARPTTAIGTSCAPRMEKAASQIQDSSDLLDFSSMAQPTRTLRIRLILACLSGFDTVGVRPNMPTFQRGGVGFASSGVAVSGVAVCAASRGPASCQVRARHWLSCCCHRSAARRACGTWDARRGIEACRLAFSGRRVG